MWLVMSTAVAVSGGGQQAPSPTLIIVLTLMHLFYCQHASAKRLGGNDVFSCNEVVEAWPGEEAGEWLAMNGSLVSPNFPKPYPARLQCRVHLKAPHGYRVQLLFTHFLLFHPLNLSNRNCDAMDSVTITDDSQHKLGTFCGPGLPSPIMSSGPHLTLVFRSYTSGPNVTGYRAVYTFLKNFGMKTGRQLDSQPCVFEYNSTCYPRGEFHSPNPGGTILYWPSTSCVLSLCCTRGTYPRNTVCHYIFRGCNHQKVKVMFKYFDVEGVAPCTAESGSDYVEFSNLPTQDILPRRCGRFAPKVVESDGPFFRVTFHSNHKFDGMGFAATFHFLSMDDNPSIIQTPSLTTAGAVSRTTHVMCPHPQMKSAFHDG
ncbi:suppressor of lurcher protein 1 isoform X2 [Procambarus clarkii]|uniref:suppressor of lurcher protein 1 isoform X2 n=1 Tax=Procambarus clarkii TaxID=6728 RepID=UPI003743A582